MKHVRYYFNQIKKHIRSRPEKTIIPIKQLERMSEQLIHQVPDISKYCIYAHIWIKKLRIEQLKDKRRKR